MIELTLVTLPAGNMGQTGTLSGSRVTGTNGHIGSQSIADALRALLLKCVTVETVATSVTPVTLCVVQTAETNSGPAVTITRLADIDIIVTLAGLAASARLSGLAKVVFIANVTSLTGVTNFAQTPG